MNNYEQFDFDFNAATMKTRHYQSNAIENYCLWNFVGNNYFFIYI